jgi:hypothetical protein
MCRLLSEFSKWPPLPWKRPKCKKNKKHKNDHSRLLAEQKLSICVIVIYLETKFRPKRRILVFGGHFVPWLPWQPHKSCHTLRWIFLQSFMKFDERNTIFFLIFQNGRRCHGNDQNAKKKKWKIGYSPNRNWWNLIGTTSTSSGTR